MDRPPSKRIRGSELANLTDSIALRALSQAELAESLKVLSDAVRTHADAVSLSFCITFLLAELCSWY